MTTVMTFHGDVKKNGPARVGIAPVRHDRMGIASGRDAMKRKAQG